MGDGTKDEPTKTLEELRAGIQREVPYIDKKPYSDTLINLSLASIASSYGKDEANKAIGDFKLEKKGWEKE